MRQPPRGAPKPAAGDLFTVRLQDGLYGVAWLTESGSPGISRGLVLVGADWFSDAPPRVPPSPLKPLRVPLAAWEGAPVKRFCIFATGRPPAGWARLGRREAIEATECASFSGDGWDWMKFHLRRHWRLAHDRAALEAEETRETERCAESAREDALRAAARLDGLTLDRLVRSRWLRTWTNYPAKSQSRACRELLRATVRTLEAEPGASARRKVQVLRQLVEALNALQAEHGFIETVCREDLCAAISDIAVAAGLRRLRDWRTIADRWRDW